jgi:membrane peptidoglycan carboxypeptidase
LEEDRLTRAYLYRRNRLRAKKGGGGGSHRALFAVMLAPILVVMTGSCVGLLGLAASYYVDVGSNVGTPEEAIAARGGGARIYARDGTLLYEYLDDNYGRQERVSLDKVSPLIQNATIAAEDASFYDNPGINVKGIARAGIENLQPGDGFLQGTGGSSITQQLVKQLYFTPQERQERSITRKLREAALAVHLTETYSKQQILEWYLNEIPYGGVLTGVEAESEGYFGIPATDVDLAQAAFLAGLPQSPAAYDPFEHMDAAINRQHEVLDLLAKHGFITQTEADWAKLEVIELHPKPQPFLAPHFVLYVGDYIKQTLGEDALLHGGLDIWTTLDLNLQTKANQYLEQHIEEYEQSSNGHNGAVVVMQPATGQILAMVGSRDYFRDDVDGTVNNAIALNSPGSTLKPFTYATAFEQGWSPDWPIVDTTINYKESDGAVFTPRNPDGRTRGIVPLKQALGNSFNIPAFKTILWVGVQNMVNTAKSMGITTLDRQLGPAVTLGGTDVKLLDMVYGYSTFANLGVMAGEPTTQSLPEGNRKLDPIAVLQVKNRNTGKILVDNTTPKYEYTIAPEYAYMITDVLSTDANRQITYGVGSSLNIPGWRVAAKTGTSEPYVDSHKIGDTWTFGYTPDIAVGVWVGNSDNSPMDNIFSTTIAGATWHDVIVEALQGLTPRDWPKPDGIVQATVCVPSGIVKQPGMNCPSITGMFAADALARQNDHWWGGQPVGQTITGNNANSIPEDITGWKRYLADEYASSYRSSGMPAPRSPAPTAPPAPGAPAPAAPPQAAPPPQPTPAPAPTLAPAPKKTPPGRAR